MIKFHKNTFEYNRKLSDILRHIYFLKHKIILVTKNKKFIGVLTDGDIRRFFMKNISQDVPIHKITNRKSIKLFENYNKEDLLKIYKSNIRYVPILSKKKKNCRFNRY